MTSTIHVFIVNQMVMNAMIELVRTFLKTFWFEGMLGNGILTCFEGF